MAFVTEKISKEDRKKLEAFHFMNPVTHEPVDFYKWTVDRERDIFLLGLGGQGSDRSEIPMFYALVWEGKVITLETFSRAELDRCAGKEQTWWTVRGIHAPSSFRERNAELLALVQEALIGKDLTGPGNVGQVDFDAIAAPLYFKGEVRNGPFTF